MMEHKQQEKQTPIKLPNNVVGLMDVNRLCREMDSIDDFLRQASIREPGTSMELPKLSKLFDELAGSNELNLLHEQDRKRLKQFLDTTRDKAPRLHISFSIDPSPLFLRRLMDYLRDAIHPTVLVQVGLQPTIGAGCVVRSTNKVFDMSLREDFKQKRGLLMDYVSSLKTQQDEQPTASQTEAAA